MTARSRPQATVGATHLAPDDVAIHLLSYDALNASGGAAGATAASHGAHTLAGERINVNAGCCTTRRHSRPTLPPAHLAGATPTRWQATRACRSPRGQQAVRRVDSAPAARDRSGEREE